MILLSADVKINFYLYGCLTMSVSNTDVLIAPYAQNIVDYLKCVHVNFSKERLTKITKAVAT